MISILFYNHKNDKIMRSTFKILFYINKNRVKNDGTTAIMCRITSDGKNSTIATGLHCGLKEWNAKKGEVRNIRKIIDYFFA